jgi:nucleoside permease NupC
MKLRTTKMISRIFWLGLTNRLSNNKRTIKIGMVIDNAHGRPHINWIIVSLMKRLTGGKNKIQKFKQTVFEIIDSTHRGIELWIKEKSVTVGLFVY